MESFPTNFETPESKIKFVNQPRILENEAEQKKNERRLALVPHIEEFLQNDEMFRDKEVEVEFSQEGISSLVSFLTTAEGKYVLKIPLTDKPEEGEATFLKEWEANGVAVPHVEEEGEIGGRPYVLMDYVPGKVLLAASKEFSLEERSEMFEEMGQTLQKMHSSSVEGYGPLTGGKPRFTQFKEWLLQEDHLKRFDLVKELGLLGDECGSLEKALDILVEYEEKNPGSNYCHFDYADYNILDTKPYTVIDPNSTCAPGIMDIGRSSLIIARTGEFEMVPKLEAGYFSKDKPYDERALQASKIFSAYIKFVYWHKNKRLANMDNIRKYLSETRSKLE